MLTKQQVQSKTPFFNGGYKGDYHVFVKGDYRGKMIDCYAELLASKPEYNNAFIYHAKATKGEHPWWRADGTPYPKEQVPKAYLAMSLLVS